MTSDLAGDWGTAPESGMPSVSGEEAGGMTGNVGSAGIEADQSGSADTTGEQERSEVRNTLDDAMQDINTLRDIGGDPRNASTSVR